MRSRLPTFALMLLLFTTMALCSTAGCNIESIWNVPCSAGERRSTLWAADPRTRGWNGVEVEYCVLTGGSVEATVRSSDRRHKLTDHGECWYENGQGDRAKSYAEQQFLVVNFGGREERYRFVHKGDMDRPCMLVEPTQIAP